MLRASGLLFAALVLIGCSADEQTFPPNREEPVSNQGADSPDTVLARDVREGGSAPLVVDDGADGTPSLETAAPADPTVLEDLETQATEGVAASETTETTEVPASPTTTTSTTTTPPVVDDCESVPENCVDAGEDFSNRDLNSAVFYQAVISGVNFTNANLADSDFSSSTAIGTNFTGAVLTDAIVEGANLTGANFSDANLTDAFFFETVLDRVVWSNTTCPDGSNSDQNGGTCEGTF